MRESAKYTNEMANLKDLMDKVGVPVEIQKEMVDGIEEVARDVDRRTDWPHKIEDCGLWLTD